MNRPDHTAGDPSHILSFGVVYATLVSLTRSFGPLIITHKKLSGPNRQVPSRLLLRRVFFYVFPVGVHLIDRNAHNRRYLLRRKPRPQKISYLHLTRSEMRADFCQIVGIIPKNIFQAEL